MTYDEIKAAVLEWQSSLSPRMRKYIHYRSMRNFVLHFDEIIGQGKKDKTLQLLDEYVQCVKANDYSFERGDSLELAKCFMNPLVPYYKSDSDFAVLVTFYSALVFGLPVDIIRYWSGLWPGIKYVPVATLLLISYHFYLVFFKAPKGRVYGLFY